MATQEEHEQICRQCGAPLAPDLRYCVQCYFPVGGAEAARPHVELARETETTHRPDPTIVFSSEIHAAIVRRARTRKRAIISGAVTIVIAVAGLVALDAFNRHRRAVQKAMAREQAALRELDLMADALERFRSDVGRYPTNEEGLRCLERRPAAFATSDDRQPGYWFGPYLDNVPEVDPWGEDYIYHTTDGGRSFELLSDGPGHGTGSESRFRVTSKVVY
jgi:general secretion pathway protein G